MSEIAVQEKAPLEELQAQMRGKDTRAQIVKVLPENVSLDKFERVTLTAIMENADLVTADRTSFFSAVMKCAADGLVPDGRQAALVIYKGKVSYQPMVWGLSDIVAEYGWNLTTAVVHAADEFEYDLGEARITHRPPKLGTDRGDRIGAYAIAVHRDGTRKIEVLDAKDVQACKAKARTDKIWNEWPDAMWRKTAAKKIAKQLPRGERETERIRRLLAETEIADPAAALYGPRAELAAVPDGAASDAKAAGGDGGPQAAPSSSPEGGAAPGFDYSSLAGDEVAASTDGSSAPSTSGDAPGGVSPAPAETVSATVAPDSTRFAGQTLAEIATAEGGEAWLLDVLTKAPAGDPFRDSVETFVQASVPAVWKGYCEAKYGSGS